MPVDPQNPTPETVDQDTPASEEPTAPDAAAEPQAETAAQPQDTSEETPGETPAEEEGVFDHLKHAAADLAGAAADRVKDVAENVVEAVKDRAEDVVETLREKAEDVVERVKGRPSLTSVDSPADLRKEGRLGYTGEVIGRTVTLEELAQIEREMAEEYSGPATDEELIRLYESSMADVTENDIVTGRVVSMTEKEIVVDIGFKSDGVVAKNEFDRELEVGEEIEVYVDRLEDRRGQLMLSKTKADELRRWRRIEEAHETGGILEGTIVRRIKGGMIVNLLGAEAFLPGSQVDVRPVRDFDAYLDKTMEFKVVKLNPTNGNVVVSHKALIEKDLMEQRQQILDTLEVGQVLEGTVKNIVNFGVFIDLGGVDGLLHITDLSWGRVGHPSEVVELDTKLNVVVLDYDKERQRISLGYKQLLPHPWDKITERYAEGQTVEGRVVSITDYGAFIELEKGIEGLVHISEMSWTEHVKHPTQKVQLGQVVPVKILKIDEDEKKISLGMKQLEPDPWEGLIARFPVGTVTTGKVRNLTTFGAFVEIEPGIDGLVHVSDLSWTKRVKHPSEVVRKGQDLDVVVLDIDVAQRRISLGHKQVSTDPWTQYEQVYAEGAETTGKVTDLNDGGLVVELPLGAEGFVPASHLARQGRPVDAYHLGDEVPLTVLRLDRDEREIVLSETAKQQAAARAEREAERAEKTRRRGEERRTVESYQRSSSGPATLGELSGLAALRDQMEAREGTPPAEGEAPSAAAEVAEAAQPEAAIQPEEAAQPEEMVPPLAGPGAASDLEGAVGTGNRRRAGKRKEEGGRGQSRATTHDAPPAEQAQRTEDAGDYPPAEMSQAAFKEAGLPEEGLAGQVEAATDDETPTTAPAPVEPEAVAVPDELAQPAGEAVAELAREAEEGSAEEEEK
jgi:small subunit ribosomal protein S1